MIYATPYSFSTKQATGDSVDSGFKTLDEVEQLPDCERIAKRIVSMGEGEERIAFSDFKLQ